MAKKKATGFAARLRELRLAASLTQADLAERAGLHLHGLTKLEQGDREPSWATAVALADALGVSCEEFRDAANDQADTPPASSKRSSGQKEGSAPEGKPAPKKRGKGKK